MFFGGFLCENVAGQSLVIVFSLFNWHENKEWKNILFMATGALMSPTSSQQGETIPGVAHLINITSED